MDGPTWTKEHEGCVLTAYADSLGNWTIGYGHTGPDVEAGDIWTQDHADAAFSADYTKAITWCVQDVGTIIWDALDVVRRAAVVDMAFQLGIVGLAEFHNFIAYLGLQQWQQAHDAMLQSKWATETPKRAKDNADLILSGVWPS